MEVGGIDYDDHERKIPQEKNTLTFFVVVQNRKKTQNSPSLGSPNLLPVFSSLMQRPKIWEEMFHVWPFAFRKKVHCSWTCGPKTPIYWNSFFASRSRISYWSQSFTVLFFIKKSREMRGRGRNSEIIARFSSFPPILYHGISLSGREKISIHKRSAKLFLAFALFPPSAEASANHSSRTDH